MTNEHNVKPDKRQGASSSSHASRAARPRRKARFLLLYLPVAIIVSLTFRAVVGQLYHVRTDALEPAVRQGSRVWVYKLTSDYKVGDIILFGRTKPRMLGRVNSVDRDGDAITIERKGETDAKISFSDVVGKVVWNTR